MFLALSKVLDLTVSPLTWVLALMVVALCCRRRARLARALVALATATLYLFSTGAVANAISRGVESSAPNTFDPRATYDVAIVLSGEVDDAASRASGRVELTQAADRIVAGFQLLREGHARALLLSGGPVEREPGERTEPELLAGSLARWGIAPERVFVEGRSRNTHENAVESARLVASHGWRTVLLVTSAAHMARAIGCFHRAGLSPHALPVDRRAAAGGSWLPRAGALAGSVDALHELAGRLAYRAMGYL